MPRYGFEKNVQSIVHRVENKHRNIAIEDIAKSFIKTTQMKHMGISVKKIE